jgi:hypothetical protein
VLNQQCVGVDFTRLLKRMPNQGFEQILQLI